MSFFRLLSGHQNGDIAYAHGLPWKKKDYKIHKIIRNTSRFLVAMQTKSTDKSILWWKPSPHQSNNYSDIKFPDTFIMYDGLSIKMYQKIRQKMHRWVNTCGIFLKTCSYNSFPSSADQHMQVSEQWTSPSISCLPFVMNPLGLENNCHLISKMSSPLLLIFHLRQSHGWRFDYYIM